MPFLRAGDPPMQPVTVCEVLKDLSAYNGKVVAVVGRFSARHVGRWLGEQKCAQKLVTGDHEWPNSLWLDYDPAGAPKPPAVLAVDAALLARKQREVKASTSLTQFAFGSSDYDSWAVAYGRIETRPEVLGAAAAGNGRKGFGYAESSPAQLVCHGDAEVVFLNDESIAPASR